MKYIYSLLLLMILLYSSCKKKDANSNSSQNSSTSSGSTTGNIILGPYNGFFQLEKQFIWHEGQVSIPSNPYISKIHLYNPAVNEHNFLAASKLGTVAVNGVVLQCSSFNVYMDSTYTLGYAPQQVISLTSTILPSFTYSVTDSIPVYTSANAILINDSIKLTSSFTIPLNGLTNYDKVYCSLTTIPISINRIISKEVGVGVNQITFTAAELATFNPGEYLKALIIIKKYNTQIFGGKKFRFEFCSFNNVSMLAHL